MNIGPKNRGVTINGRKHKFRRIGKRYENVGKWEMKKRKIKNTKKEK